jgi:hypothetical protein
VSELTFVASKEGVVTGVLEFMAPSFIDFWHKGDVDQTKLFASL